MTHEHPDELYLRWLYSQVASVRYRNPYRTYWSLARQLYITEFVWFVPNDDNRVEDGRNLRNEFLTEHPEAPVNDEWVHAPCSMLEMLIALSRRLSFEAEGEPRAWFWHLLRNIDLHEVNDGDPYPEEDVTDVLNTVIFRQYRPDGHGGLFPLEDAHADQRQVELWYQMAAYLLQ